MFFIILVKLKNGHSVVFKFSYCSCYFRNAKSLRCNKFLREVCADTKRHCNIFLLDVNGRENINRLLHFYVSHYWNLLMRNLTCYFLLL